MPCSSFPVGRSGPRVAPPERQLDMGGAREGMSRNWGLVRAVRS